ncbi:MAG TPA: hypothetical protein VIN10_01220 [Bacteroidales bacterium]
MMKKLFILAFAVFSAVTTYSQKSNFGISIYAVNDINWNNPIDNAPAFPPITLYSKMPIKFGVSYEREYKKVSPSLGINLIYRTIKYTGPSTETNLNQYNLEIPLNVNFRKPLSQDLALIFNLGGGINYVLTSDENLHTGFEISDTLVYNFDIVYQNKLNGFATAGMGMECSFNHFGKIQFKLEYFFQFSKQLQYEYSGPYFSEITDSYRLNYGAIGLVYIFPHSKKSK